MYDIFYVSSKTVNIDEWNSIKSKYPTAQKLENVKNFDQIKKLAFTKMFWVVWADVVLNDSFNLTDYRVEGWDENYIHLFKNDNAFAGGIALFPKNISISDREFRERYYLEKKEIDIQASRSKLYDKWCINSYDDYQTALNDSATDMFWVIPSDVEILETFKFDLILKDKFDLNINHVFLNKDRYDGIMLCSKNKPLSKKEIENRYPLERKEWGIIASQPIDYEKFKIDTYDEYLSAVNKSTTELFWAIPSDVNVLESFDFSIRFEYTNKYDRMANHVFLNGNYYDGIILFSKHRLITEDEFNSRKLIEKKEWNITASIPKIREYDIIFISYNELNADDNYQELLKRFPRAKRVHGVKGIHQAHIEAAKLSNTDMFWVVDADAKIIDSFNFKCAVSKHESDAVRVWRSQNPINGLIYGYGGVKLLPTKQTLNMNLDNADMTTSISSKFFVMPEISNITAFNTDSFNTWKSAFRECVKLSSKSIDRQHDSETAERLDAWCNSQSSEPYADDAIKGARAGKKYGEENSNNPETLKKINDFEWLLEQWKKK